MTYRAIAPRRGALAASILLLSACSASGVSPNATADLSPAPTSPASRGDCTLIAYPSTIEAGPVRMDVERHVVTVDGQEQRLPLKEFELLEMFLRNPGRVLTRGQLIDRVWGSDYVGDTKTLDVHVKRLRSKIEPDPAVPTCLLTVRGLGYKLEA